MGIKCWTCFWVILGAHRATTYTPLNQWGLGFVVKPRAQCESLFPGQSPCPRSGLLIFLPSEKALVQVCGKSAADQQPEPPSEWHPPQQEQRKDEASRRNRNKQNKTKKQPDNPAVSLATACWCCCVYDLSPPTSYPHAPPPVDDKKNPLFNQQWQRLTQIAWRRLHGGVARFTEATGFSWWRVTGCHKMCGTWGRWRHGRGPWVWTAPLQVVMWDKHRDMLVAVGKLEHAALQAACGVTSDIYHWHVSYRGLIYLAAAKFIPSLSSRGPAEGWSREKLASFITGTFKINFKKGSTPPDALGSRWAAVLDQPEFCS